MKCEDCVASEVSVWSTAQHSLHERVELGDGDVGKAIQPVAHMIEPTALCDLAEFDRRHSDSRRVCRSDVPILIERQVVQCSAVRNGQTRDQYVNTVPQSVRY